MGGSKGSRAGGTPVRNLIQRCLPDRLQLDVVTSHDQVEVAKDEITPEERLGILCEGDFWQRQPITVDEDLAPCPTLR